MFVSVLALAVEVGDPLRLFGVVIALVAVGSLVRVALLCALVFLLFWVSAILVANVTVRGVAFLRPHVVVGDAAEAEGEDAESEVVKPTDRHLLVEQVGEDFVCLRFWLDILVAFFPVVDVGWSAVSIGIVYC